MIRILIILGSIAIISACALDNYIILGDRSKEESNRILASNQQRIRYSIGSNKNDSHIEKNASLCQHYDLAANKVVVLINNEAVVNELNDCAFVFAQLESTDHDYRAKYYNNVFGGSSCGLAKTRDSLYELFSSEILYSDILSRDAAHTHLSRELLEIIRNNYISIATETISSYRAVVTAIDICEELAEESYVRDELGKIFRYYENMGIPSLVQESLSISLHRALVRTNRTSEDEVRKIWSEMVSSVQSRKNNISHVSQLRALTDVFENEIYHMLKLAKYVEVVNAKSLLANDNGFGVAYKKHREPLYKNSQSGLACVVDSLNTLSSHLDSRDLGLSPESHNSRMITSLAINKSLTSSKCIELNENTVCENTSNRARSTGNCFLMHLRKTSDRASGTNIPSVEWNALRTEINGYMILVAHAYQRSVRKIL